jgi:hypothetical protein
VTRIVEHRSALPFGPVVELHVRYDPECEFPVHAKVEIVSFGAILEPKPFPEILPVADASSKRSHMPSELELLAYGLTTPGVTSLQISVLSGM